MSIFRRPDGRPVKGLHPIRRMMPHLMKGRNESYVLHEQTIETEPGKRFVEAFNAGRPPERCLTLFHLLLRGIAIVLGEYPRLNRFVASGRLYDRDGIWLSFSLKKRMDPDAPIAAVKARFDPADSIDAMLDRIHDTLSEGRSDKGSASEKEVKLLTRLPSPLLRLGIGLFRFLDGLGLAPRSMIATDPLYASAFIANLGSVGIEAGYHHLYEWGTISIFITMGKLKQEPVIHDGGGGAQRISFREVYTLRYTYDERIEDGFYCARALERLKALLEDPKQLE